MPQAAIACRPCSARALREGESPAPAGLPRKFYRPRDHETSPFFKIVRDRFDDFERVYPERYQQRYGYWRPVIRSSIDKFLKCGDFKEGFARVRCKDCGEEFFVAFSCRQRSCCPSCDQKRALLLGHRLKEEVLAEVPHLQWVFTIPKRLRVYFRYDRKLLGKLCRAAYDTVCNVYGLEIDGDCGVPAMVGAVQTFGDLIHWHSHIHAIVPEGVFTGTGHFVHIPDIWKHRAADIWQEKVFELLLDACKIDPDVAANMRGWRHSGLAATIQAAALRASQQRRALRASLRFESTSTTRYAYMRATMRACSAWWRTSPGARSVLPE
jgi:hypothetical protein